MQKIRLIIVPGIIAITLFIGINSFDTQTYEVDTRITNLNFNAYSEGINTALYDAEGNINYTLQADRQVHYNDDSTELEQPLIRVHQGRDLRWNIAANSGKILASKTTGDRPFKRIELNGDVQVTNLDEFGNRTVISTEFLTLNTKLEILETDQKLSIMTSALQQSSVGMVARLRTDEINFLSEIRGRYEQTKN